MTEHDCKNKVEVKFLLLFLIDIFPKYLLKYTQ